LLLALDGSDQSMDTVRYIAQAGPRHLKEILLFHVWEKIPGEYYLGFENDPQFAAQIRMIGAWEAKQREKIDISMENARRVLIEAGLPEPMVKVRIADKVQDIAGDLTAETLKGYAAVVGRTGSKRLKDYVLGSIAYKVVGRIVDNDVCLVSGAPETTRLLWAVSPTPGALRAEGVVRSLLQGGLRDLVIFHAAREKEVSLEAMEALDMAKDRLVESGVLESRVKVLARAGVGSRSAAIIETARSEGCGSVVIGRRGRSQAAEFFIGRVANRVIHQAVNLAVWIAG
jgi:nucleotide-binding universal stress UspA family protein